MVESIGNYKIVSVDDKANYIAANHENKELQISSDIKLSRTDNGELCAIFQNQQTKPSAKDFILGLFGKQYTPNSSDCSIIISDPVYFNHCIKKDGEYELSGSKVTFNGTDKDDKLILKEVTHSKINMGGGDDTVLIKGDSPQSHFFNNIVKTQDGADSVTILGDFKYIHNNQFYLGKGSDKFSATINSDDDAKAQSEFERNLPKYGAVVSKNEIYAIDGYTGDGDKKEWFETNVFEAKTYCANQLFRYNASTSGIDGFQVAKSKPEPKVEYKSLTKVLPKDVQQPKQETSAAKPKKEITIEDCNRMYWASSMLLMLHRKEGAEGLKNALDNYMDLMQK